MTIPNASTDMCTATKLSDLRDRFLSQIPALKARHAPKNATIVQEGDIAESSIFLLEGWVAHSKLLRGGDVQIIDLMLPGDFALIGARAAPVAACSLEALSDVSYIMIPTNQINGSDPASTELREILAGALVTTQSRTAEILLRMGTSSAASRVAYALLELYVRLEAEGMTDGETFEFPMTQQKLGEFTGLTGVHVCRTLRRFVRNGLIAYPDSVHLTLSDIDALADIAEIEMDVFRDEILMNRILGMAIPQRHSTISPNA